MTSSRDESIPNGFDQPTALPQSDEQARQWQEANRTWWEQHPMRYDWKQKLGHEEFSIEFYQEIDRRFFSDVQKFMPWRSVPFDPLIDFDAIRSMDVLEIGVGNGSHAQLLATHARSFTGIDLTEYATQSTSKRMQRFGLNATILRMDAEHMEFPDNSFDFIWSWGVIHHSSDTRSVLKEMHRVLRPGGRAITMVYHRNVWNYYITAGGIKGILLGDLFKTRSVHKTRQRMTDGAIARYYKSSEWDQLVSECFDVERIYIYGTKAEMIPLLGGRVKNVVMAMMPNAFGRFLTNTCHLGQFLVARFKKR